MNNLYPKISIIIITYNQEKFISRAIDSVLNQENYLHELIISDDCSQDKTWDIIKKYKEKYPEKLKIQRHKQNLGIYENLESTYHLVTGEIIFFLDGDDAMGEILLKSTCEFLVNKEIDYKKDRFCVLTDYKVIYPDGREEVRSNAIVKKYDPLELKFRGGIIANRALGETRAIFEIRKKISISKLRNGMFYSALQEGLFDAIPYYYAEKIYHIPIIGNIYYANIGISKKLAQMDREVLLSTIDICENIPKYFEDLSIYIMNWLNFLKIKSQFILNPNIRNYFRYLLVLLKLIKDPLRKILIIREIKTFIKLTINLIIKF